MAGNVYERLAERLDQIPNGFKRTESGVELELLARIFTPEEARVASVMRLSPEPPEAIAERLGTAVEEVSALLVEMSRNGLIRAIRTDGGAVFGLLPFVVGIYEEQLPRLDKEMATLFERYMKESGGGSIADGGTSVHRVIPVEESVPVDLEIFPYERASSLLDKAKSWGVRRCICRVQQKLVGKGCDHTVENCLVFAPSEGAFEESEATRTITREEAHRILAQAAEEGLVHSTMNQRDQIFYICNCCTCCCGVIRGVAEFAVPTALARSDFRAAVNEDACVGCGVCVDRCGFGALAVDDDVCRVDYARCVGCGVCVAGCAVGALFLERRPEGETEEPPANYKEWLGKRAAERGISLKDIL
jgi:Na+-translocating ferredoxin:NAD+ oxidoreductase subunit B